MGNAMSSTMAISLREAEERFAEAKRRLLALIAGPIGTAGSASQPSAGLATTTTSATLAGYHQPAIATTSLPPIGAAYWGSTTAIATGGGSTPTKGRLPDAPYNAVRSPLAADPRTPSFQGRALPSRGSSGVAGSGNMRGSRKRIGPGELPNAAFAAGAAVGVGMMGTSLLLTPLVAAPHGLRGQANTTTAARTLAPPTGSHAGTSTAGTQAPQPLLSRTSSFLAACATAMPRDSFQPERGPSKYDFDLRVGPAVPLVGVGSTDRLGGDRRRSHCSSTGSRSPVAAGIPSPAAGASPDAPTSSSSSSSSSSMNASAGPGTSGARLPAGRTHRAGLPYATSMSLRRELGLGPDGHVVRPRAHLPQPQQPQPHPQPQRALLRRGEAAEVAITAASVPHSATSAVVSTSAPMSASMKQRPWGVPEPRRGGSVSRGGGESRGGSGALTASGAINSAIAASAQTGGAGQWSGPGAATESPASASPSRARSRSGGSELTPWRSERDALALSSNHEHRKIALSLSSGGVGSSTAPLPVEGDQGGQLLQQKQRQRLQQHTLTERTHGDSGGSSTVPVRTSVSAAASRRSSSGHVGQQKLLLHTQTSSRSAHQYRSSSLRRTTSTTAAASPAGNTVPPPSYGGGSGNGNGAAAAAWGRRPALRRRTASAPRGATGGGEGGGGGGGWAVAVAATVGSDGGAGERQPLPLLQRQQQRQPASMSTSAPSRGLSRGGRGRAQSDRAMVLRRQYGPLQARPAAVPAAAPVASSSVPAGVPPAAVATTSGVPVVWAVVARLPAAVDTASDSNSAVSSGSSSSSTTSSSSTIGAAPQSESSPAPASAASTGRLNNPGSSSSNSTIAILHLGTSSATTTGLGTFLTAAGQDDSGEEPAFDFFSRRL